MAAFSFSMSTVAFSMKTETMPLRSQRQSFRMYTGLKACAFPPPPTKMAAVLLRASPLHVQCAAEPKTLEAVQSIVATQLAVELSTVHPSSKFTDLGADSLDTVEIVMALEEQFKITMEEEGAEKISTVQDAADLVQEIISSVPQ